MPIPFSLGGDVLDYVYTPGKTAEHVINRAAVELGLAAVADPYASTDPNFIALRYRLTSLGQDLWRERNWAHLTREYEFTTEEDVRNYVLPADFGRMIDQTGWNTTSGQPLGGPQTPQEWQTQQNALGGSVSFRISFRPWKGQIYLNGTVPEGEVIRFEYMSKWWVQPEGSDNATTDEPTASTDILWFDPALLIKGLKLAWRKDKKFDTTSEQLEFDRMLQQSMGDDSPGPVIRVGGGRGGLLGFNVPDSGVGQ
jgi:hypothetical protein